MIQKFLDWRVVVRRSGGLLPKKRGVSHGSLRKQVSQGLPERFCRVHSMMKTDTFVNFWDLRIMLD